MILQPQRSKLLPLLLAQQSQNTTNPYVSGGAGGLQAYRGFKQLGGSDDSNTAGIANMAGGALTAAGGLNSGTIGRIAQIAGLMTSQYAKGKGYEDMGARRAKMLETPQAERDASWYTKMANLLYNQGDD